MRVVREISIKPGSRVCLDLPKDAEILGTFYDNRSIVIRFMTDPKISQTYPVILRMAMTGELIPYNKLKYIGSVRSGEIPATHLFIELESEMSVTVSEAI